MKKIIVLLVMAFPFLLLAQEAPVKAVSHETVKVPCDQIDSIIAFSKTKLGCKYKYSGSGPEVFDCSGFVMFVYGHFGVELPHGSSSQYLLGRKVKRQDIRPGDLLFFNRSKGIGHVAMVTEVDTTGKVTFIHASTYRTGVKFDRLESEHYANTFVGARRILECVDDSSYRLAYSDDEVAAVERAAVTVQPATDSYYYHKVKSGETLSSISRKYGTNVVSIKNWNNLHSDNIREGQVLKIYRKAPVPAPVRPVVTEQPVNEEPKPVAAAQEPVVTETQPQKEESQPVVTETPKPTVTETPKAETAPEPKWIYHTVAKGEGLYGIARKYGTTVEKIQKWNNISNPDKIAEGQKLKIMQ